MEIKFEVGDKVHYEAPHGATENGIIKSVGDHSAFVVYKCGGDWEHYADYTGSRTYLEHIKRGWV